MTWLIWVIIGLSITYYMGEKTHDVLPRQKRQTPIINTGINKFDFYIFFGVYVLLGLIVFVSGHNPFYFFENHDWALGLSITLNYGWWYMFFEGRKWTRLKDHTSGRNRDSILTTGVTDKQERGMRRLGPRTHVCPVLGAESQGSMFQSGDNKRNRANGKPASGVSNPTKRKLTL